MAGSQATITPPLTWLATHAAACWRVAAAGLDVPRGGRGEPVNRPPPAPAARKAVTARAARQPKGHRRRRGRAR